MTGKSEWELNWDWAIPEKIQTVGVEDMEFPGVSNKYITCRIFRGWLKTKWISESDQEKIMWNFQGS